MLLPDFLYGEAGNDAIVGYSGKNVIFGGDGNDILDSDEVEYIQIMSGGAGANLQSRPKHEPCCACMLCVANGSACFSS